MVGKLHDVVKSSAETTPKTPPPISEQDFARFKPNKLNKPVESKSETNKVLTPAEKEEEKQKQSFLKAGDMKEETVAQMTEIFNDVLDKINCDVELQYNQKAGMFNVKMIDKKTNEVIKEFPPEEMLENIIRNKEIRGAIIDQVI